VTIIIIILRLYSPLRPKAYQLYVCLTSTYPYIEVKNYLTSLRVMWSAVQIPQLLLAF
jgi:hypothetical protein